MHCIAYNNISEHHHCRRRRGFESSPERISHQKNGKSVAHYLGVSTECTFVSHNYGTYFFITIGHQPSCCHPKRPEKKWIPTPSNYIFHDRTRHDDEDDACSVFFRVVGHCAILYGSDQQLKLQLMFNCIAILHPRRRIASQIQFNCSAVWRLVQRFLGFSVGLIDDATNAPGGVMIT